MNSITKPSTFLCHPSSSQHTFPIRDGECLGILGNLCSHSGKTMKLQEFCRHDLFYLLLSMLWSRVLNYIPVCLIVIARIIFWVYFFGAKEYHVELRFIWATIGHNSQPCYKIFAYKWLNQHHNPHQSSICGLHEHQKCGKHSQPLDNGVQNSM